MIDVALLEKLLEGRCASAAQRDAFEAAGCTFDDSGALVETGLGVWVDYLQRRDLQRHVAVYRQTRSTQDIARGLVEQLGGRADGAVVLTDAQSAGRGRLGRPWVAPPGGALLMSRACAGGDLRGDRLFLATAVAAARAIEQVTRPPLGVQIKWPNDLLYDGRKLAGILVEAFSTSGQSAAVIGIGVNVNAAPPLATATATSLRDCGRPIDRLALADALMMQLDAALGADEAELLDAWRSRSTLLSAQVELISGGHHISGEVIDLDPADGLVVRTNDGAMLHLPAATTTFVK